MTNSSIVLIAVVAMLCFIIPFTLLIFWHRKQKVSIKPFFYGALFFIIFVNVLESGVHAFVFNNTTLLDHPILFMFYGGLMAGIFEETARFVFFKNFKNVDSIDKGIVYGIGHGGIEMILILGLSMISALTILIPAKQMGIEAYMATVDPANIELVNAYFSSFANYGLANAFVSLFERLVALTLQLSLTVIVYYAVRYKKNISFYIIAIGLHALVDFPAALYQIGLITNIYLVELLILVLAIPSIYIAKTLYKEMKII